MMLAGPLSVCVRRRSTGDTLRRVRSALVFDLRVKLGQGVGDGTVWSGACARVQVLATRPSHQRGCRGPGTVCVVVSSVRNKPEMCEHLQNELYAPSGVARALDGGGGEILISHNLDHYNMQRSSIIIMPH